MDLQAYKRVLGSHILPNAEFLAGKKLKFQQDNVPVQANNSKKHSLLVHVETLKRPDLNPKNEFKG